MIRRFLKTCAGMAAIATVFLFSSCINDDQDDCGLNLRFRYDYNIKSADAFPAEVKNVTVFVFGDDGKYVQSYAHTTEKFGTGYVMNIRGLKAGDYTFVCLARDSVAYDADKNFVFSGMKEGVSTVDDLTERLTRDGRNTCDNRIAALYVAKKKVHVGTAPQTEVMSLMKCTNRMKVIILPYRSGETTVTPENFDIRIEGASGWLAHDGERFKKEPVTYLPYDMGLYLADENSRADDGTVDRAVVADLNVSRIFRDSNPRIVISDKRNGNRLLDMNLAWLLSLQGIGEHRQEWSDQEYLDRQDYYAMTFFVDGDQFFMGKIIVNGWVLNPIDTGLGGN